MNRRIPRTRTGCLCCRQRKKKCDETKPQCRACTRNKLKCAWPPHIVRIFGLDSGPQMLDDALPRERDLTRGFGHPETENAPASTSSSARPASMDSNSSSDIADRSPDERENHIASWCSELKTFLSPRRAMLLPESQVLLSHYLDVTGPKLAPAPDTPFVSWLLPVAYSDDLLMNGILALSGGHLLYKLPDNHAIQQATSRHYSLAVQSLHRVLNDESTLLEPLVLIRVVLAIVILFHYEVVSGHLDGSPFTHLRAGRHLILRLRNCRHQLTSSAERKLFGFVAEVYSYIVLSNSITPFNMNCNRTLIYDSFLQSLDDLRDLGAFGVMFSGFHSLFELISSISLFAGEQEAQPSTGPSLPLDRYETYNQLKMRIDHLDISTIEHPDTEVLPGHSTALGVFRIALLVFLETAVSPFSKHDSMRVHHLQPLLDRAVHDLPGMLASNYSCLMMWPIMVIGSCLMKNEQRNVITHLLIHNHYLMRNTAQASVLLQLLWDDPDEYAFGPYGLGLLMRGHGLHYGVI
ncbi:fungal-specific transcription factor domain-containing protein [Aspergillus pseudonomiae]|uniref:Fungal-specific transcription factor domain-containing protein n=1 Tax=Aspergillus pseudonomiae TaxID=1506151 RepID=A0A5N7CTH4_9EURO|nr:fungal-specific transcription factor domain-containing protein [Aspergillus pseudonomiae]KAB8262252.1 fungal-specific transcription factor domain-containing protein [Aspergillus pseudonomiae]KAE8397454.1 fungal-specific transcription factor domain-containing protein [Aspergillus pseudonomiae]